MSINQIQQLINNIQRIYQEDIPAINIQIGQAFLERDLNNYNSLLTQKLMLLNQVHLYFLTLQSINHGN